jgi:hypothetical protein
MKPFTKKEIITVSLILFIIGLAIFPNMKAALRRARDAQRREDLGRLSEAINAYREKFSFVPPSDNGLIKACKGNNFNDVILQLNKNKLFDKNLFFSGQVDCLWGQDALKNLMDDNISPYIKTLPLDPKYKDGINYLYLSDTNFYQVYIYLEGEKEENEYNEGVVKRNLLCGTKICNAGKAYTGVPLDRSLEEYEQELINKSRK